MPPGPAEAAAAGDEDALLQLSRFQARRPWTLRDFIEPNPLRLASEHGKDLLRR